MKKTQLFFLLIFIFSVSLPALGDDIQDCVDRALRTLRAQQNPDGSYGSGEGKTLTTSMVLLAFGTSPRRYTDLDGPFIRMAADYLQRMQGPDGSIRSATQESTFQETALAVAALAVTSKRRSSSLDKGTAYLLDACGKEGEPTFSKALFALVMALKETDPDKLGQILPRSAGDRDQNAHSIIYQALWNTAQGKNLPRGFDLTSLVGNMESLFKGEDESQTGTDHAGLDAGAAASMDLWAGLYLLALLHDQDQAPPRWANRISETMMPCLDGMLQYRGREGRIRTTALLCNALSLCYKRTYREAAPPVTNSDDFSPFVAAPRAMEDALSLALDFLDTQHEAGKFGFSGYPDPGISALVLSAVIRTSRCLNREIPDYVPNGLAYLQSLQKEDGSIYQHGLANYVTSASIMAFKDAGDPAYQEVIQAAGRFLVTLQADEDEGYSQEADPFYGGMGYGGDERPDLSNTQMSIEALRAAGLDEEDEAFRKAVLFLQKCQNLAEVNPTSVWISPTEKIVSGKDGGGKYSPTSSKAELEEIDKGIFVARSYGSMTYALLKSYILAGLEPGDKRVEAAVRWIENHYTLEENPGFETGSDGNAGQQGLFYYYLTLARALSVLEKETIETPDGSQRAWRTELRAKLLKLQRQDGSWVNHRAPRWFEGNPVLATAYALLVLDQCAVR